MKLLSFRKKKLRRSNTFTRLGVFFFMMILLFVTIGYSYLNTSLDVKGTVILEAPEEDLNGKDDNQNDKDDEEEDPNLLTLYKIIKAKAKDEEINFSETSRTLGNNGVYTTIETEGNIPVYYYRGDYNLTYNNLIFNNMCWKIIRTTETFGVKIIYNGVPIDGRCNTQKGEGTQIGKSSFNEEQDDNAYVGYMYGTPKSPTYQETHSNISDSSIKSYIESWYTDNFSLEMTSKLEDTIFCSDRSTKSYDANTIGGTNYIPDGSLLEYYGDLGYASYPTLYGTAHRASYYAANPSPSLICVNENDRFTTNISKGNGKLKHPVGLITLDEVILAGYNTNASNNTNYHNEFNYLHTGNYYWTMSPINVFHYGYAAVGLVSNTGDVDDDFVNVVYDVRPVVSLKKNTTVTGVGSSTYPYIVD